MKFEGVQETISRGVTEQFHVDPDKVGLIIGSQGSNIHKVKQLPGWPHLICYKLPSILNRAFLAHILTVASRMFLLLRTVCLPDASPREFAVGLLSTFFYLQVLIGLMCGQTGWSRFSRRM